MGLTERLVVLLGVAEIEQLGGGHQSRVFRVVRRDGGVLAAKVLDAAMVDRPDLDARHGVAAALADLDPRVCRPLPVGRRLVTEATLDGNDHYVVCFEFADGRALDPSSLADAERMGRALADLHASMSQLAPMLSSDAVPAWVRHGQPGRDARRPERLWPSLVPGPRPFGWPCVSLWDTRGHVGAHCRAEGPERVER